MCINLASTKFSDFVNSRNQVTIHFAGLGSTILAGKPNSLKLLNLILAKFIYIEVFSVIMSQLQPLKFSILNHDSRYSRYITTSLTNNNIMFSYVSL